MTVKQTQIEGTEPKKQRSARELADEAAAKARLYRRKALLAEDQNLNSLKLAIRHGRELSCADPKLVGVFEALLAAQKAFDIYLEDQV